MLRGHVFSKQLFGNPIFALFVNTFLNGKNGISDNYKNGMAVTYSGNNVTVDSGAVCIQGRYLEEDTSTTISAGSDTSYCKLVIEINLDNTNTENDFTQGSYKIIKGANSYPALTQTNIVKNNAGIYQYELARFRNATTGITEFQDMRTFLDFDSIYDEIEQHIEDIDDGSAFVNKSDIAVLTGTITTTGSGSSESTEFTSKSIDFPTGFNKDNCVVIANGLRDISFTTRGYGFGNTNAADPRSWLRNGLNRMCLFNLNGDNKINYTLETPYNSAHTFEYKIVLMKIS